MPSIRAPATKKATTLSVLIYKYTHTRTWIFVFDSLYVYLICSSAILQVAVKCRPLAEKERGRDIVRVIDHKVCGVLANHLFVIGINLFIY